MSIYYAKTIISVFMVLMVLFNVFAMLEVFGRGETRYDANRLKKLHRINGYFFILLYFSVTYFCLRSIINGQMELSPRSAFHTVFALAVILLIALKVSFIRGYRQFYSKVLIIGPVIALTALGMIGTSGGYYLLVTRFHTDRTFDEIREYKDKGMEEKTEATGLKVKTDPESIKRGEKLFIAKCIFCHDFQSNKAGIGPGLKGLLKNSLLPISRRPANAENIRRQLRQPFSRMPSFDKLSEDEVADIIAFLNAL